MATEVFTLQKAGVYLNDCFVAVKHRYRKRGRPRNKERLREVGRRMVEKSLERDRHIYIQKFELDQENL